MSSIDLTEAMQKAALDEFWAIRGAAVQAYANLEQSLCRVFAYVSETHPEVAAVIFFKISSPRARYSMIERLLKRKFQDRYVTFWNSVARLLGATDNRRNEIVHWSAINNVALQDGKLVSDLSLRQPTYWIAFSAPSLSKADMNEFINRCSFFRRLCNQFWMEMSGQAFTDPERQTWRDICQQEVVYPPPDTHPLSPNYKAPQSPPPASQG